jgi:hypothetical protein
MDRPPPLTRDEHLAYFMKRIDTRGPGGCWIWIGSVNPVHGYGEASIGRRGDVRRWRAHRLSFWLFDGRDPGELMVMHACDVRACVNPDHLSLGTALDNVRDMITKGRRHHVSPRKPFCASGRHAMTDDNVYVTPKDGLRSCHACKLERARKYKLALKLRRPNDA